MSKSTPKGGAKAPAKPTAPAKNPFAKLAPATGGQVAADTKRDVNFDRPRETAMLPITSIGDRAHGDKRPLSLAHVVDLALTIAIYDLIQPLAVDLRNRLIAGGHRRASCMALAYVANPERYKDAFFALWPEFVPREQIEEALQPLRSTAEELPMLEQVKAWFERTKAMVPVRILSFDSDSVEDRAKISEILENEKRKNFTPQEIAAAAKDLQSKGYRDLPGRPKIGEQSLKRALTIIFGISYSTVRRILAEDQGDTPAPAAAKPSAAAKLIKAVDAYVGSDEANPAVIERLKKLRDEIAAAAKN